MSWGHGDRREGVGPSLRALPMVDNDGDGVLSFVCRGRQFSFRVEGILFLHRSGKTLLDRRMTLSTYSDFSGGTASMGGIRAW